MSAIREPAVAGQFYPADAGELSQTVGELIDGVEPAQAARRMPMRAPKALIVPHAGYVYSGPVAAMAYARLSLYRDRVDRVVLFGPCHRVPVRGLALSGAGAFRTPLGNVPVDREACNELLAPDVTVFEASHAFEHCLEVQLPFLQTVLGAFRLVPVLVGSVTPARVAEVLNLAWNGPRTLIVISSDLSHYLGYDRARQRDTQTCAAIEALDAGPIDHESACGATPIGGLLMAARERGMTVTTLALRNSGDTAGDRQRVVGYGCWEFHEPFAT